MMSVAIAENKSGKAAAALAQREARVLEINQEIADLHEAEENARFAVLLADPSAKTTAIQAEPAKLARKRETLETELRGINKDIPPLREVLRIKMIEANKDLLEANGKIVAGLSDEQKVLWAKAGTELAVLHETWAGICAVAEQHDTFAVGAEHDNFNGSDQARDEWRRVAAFPVQPMPVTFRAFLETLVKGTLDPHGNGYRSGGAYLDDLNVLVEILPDLQDKNVRPELSGRVGKRGE